jgi:hypothetical protein
MPIFETPLPEFPPGSSTPQKTNGPNQTNRKDNSAEQGSTNQDQVGSLEDNLRKIKEAEKNNANKDK